MYYISMYVTPYWKQTECKKVKKALAHFWVDEKDPVKAFEKAVKYSVKHKWEIHSIEHTPSMIGDEDQIHGAMGLTHSHRAREQCISMCFTNWEI